LALKSKKIPLIRPIPGGGGEDALSRKRLRGGWDGAPRAILANVRICVPNGLLAFRM
jgi:hypothetical protein